MIVLRMYSIGAYQENNFSCEYTEGGEDDTCKYFHSVVFNTGSCLLCCFCSELQYPRDNGCEEKNKLVESWYLIDDRIGCSLYIGLY